MNQLHVWLTRNEPQTQLENHEEKCCFVGSIFEHNSMSQAFKTILQTKPNELECDCGFFKRALVRKISIHKITHMAIPNTVLSSVLLLLKAVI